MMLQRFYDRLSSPDIAVPFAYFSGVLHGFFIMFAFLYFDKKERKKK